MHPFSLSFSPSRSFRGVKPAAALCSLLLCVTASLAQAPSRSSTQPAAADLDQTEARRVLHQVIDFYRQQVGFQGAYLWRYSGDLTKQEGEGEATKTSGWTQPPGTPSVGEAYLEAWRLTGDPQCLEAAVETARALVRAQLKSGGWSSHFDLGEKGRRQYAYRTDGERAGKNNYTTFDDNKSQSALMLLMHVDEALHFDDAPIHETVEYALEKMLAAQYPNGAWPQQYDEPVDPSEYRVLAASYPESWPRDFPKKDYRGYYTLNDNNMANIIDMLLEAERIYDRQDCYRAAEKTGDFFLLAQMPEPQPGWAQQYNLKMQPSWARKFEPPAITGGESQGVMRALLRLYQYTAREDFIATLPRALAYYRDSLLPDGQLARFYELRTNRPLYFTKEYELTYSDADMPTHYAFQVSSKLDSLQREYDRLLAKPKDQLKPKHQPTRPAERTRPLKHRAEEAVGALDERGAWIERGRMRDSDATVDVIDMRTFIDRLETLARYAGAHD